MSLFSYVITRDYGFAPNPFGGYCTLATCKPRIRKVAKVGDWVIGTGSNSKKGNMGNRLIYTMKVEEIITFANYWNDSRFQDKKPVMNGSKRQKYGDNIYYFDETENKFIQVNSHHSLVNGDTNEINYKRDLSGKNVLISKYFWYFGENAPSIPNELVNRIVKDGIGYKKVEDDNLINIFVAWLSNNFETGYNGMPYLFKGKFERYDGK